MSFYAASSITPRRASILLSLLTVVGLVLAMTTHALAGPNAGGVLIVHGDPEFAATGSECGAINLNYCNQADPWLPADGERYTWWVLAAFPDGSSPRMTGVQFGIDYWSDEVEITDWGICGDLAIPDQNWPQPGSGISVVWTSTQTSQVTPVGWFETRVLQAYVGYSAYVYIEESSRPEGGAFVDDSVPGILDPIADYGVMGFGDPGENYCPETPEPPGACCIANSCSQLTPSECAVQGGTFHGSGVSCQDVQCEPAPSCSRSPSNGLSFGSVEVGSSRVESFTIQNVGGGVLTGTVSVSCSGFTLISPASYSLAAGQSQSFSVRFAPTSEGPYSCSASTGSGCPGSYALTGNGFLSPAVCNVSPSTLDFGSVDVDGGVATRSFTVSNTGGQTLEGFILESCTHFAIEGGIRQISVPGGEQETISVVYDPTTAGHHTCTISVADGCEVSAHGTGVSAPPAECQLDRSTLTFGDVEVDGAAEVLSFTISNVGGETLSGNVRESCTGFEVTRNGGAFNLAPGQSRTVDVSFDPTFAREYECEVFVSDDCSVVARGRGTAPQCDVPASLEFPDTRIGDRAIEVIPIRNTGTATLSVHASFGSGSQCEAFRIVGSPNFDVPAGGTANLEIEFAPSQAGLSFCTLDLGTECASSVLVTASVPEPTGACCLPDGSCQQLDEVFCDAYGGSYNGHYSLCEDADCVSPDGACCLGEECRILTGDECSAIGGSFAGPGSSCASDPCSVPTEPTVLFFEDWEGSQNSWTVSGDQDVWEVGFVDGNPSRAVSGGRYLGTVIGSHYPVNRLARYISPEIQVPPASHDPRLRFWHWFELGKGSDGVAVEVRAAGSGQWEEVWGFEREAGDDAPDTRDLWTPISIPLDRF
ncbi:MAG: choice-of-anchor D domain-containing protein, partial [Candidatus Eisenbacteria bacterium]|nr:choice-of-anchor D domain-containing protein [Candidatus Eisenbacteria bacterium]